MDKILKSIADSINKTKNKVRAIASDPEGSLKSGFMRSHLVRPRLSKDEKTAEQEAFMKKSDDGSGYVAGLGFKSLEEEAILSEQIEKCLKID